MNRPLIIMGAAGRMGLTIHTLAKERGFSVAALMEREESLAKLSVGMVSGSATPPLIGSDVDTLYGSVKDAVIIDFTAPEASIVNARAAAKYGHALIIGTTGFDAEQKAELDTLAQKARIFWSPNMSVGINVMCEILPKLVQMLGLGYDLELVELHHNRKKDAPSGTALRIAEVLAEARSWDLDEVGCYHREGLIGARPEKEIGVQTVRGGDVVGVHTVYMMGQGERLEFTHHAHSRENFAEGALRAAAWLPSQVVGRVYTMKDVLLS